ncbi:MULTISPECIES: transposase [Aerococcus]|nr:transposase [Aerococcus urinae]
MSNDPIEGINNKTKLIKRKGYEYRRFDHLKYL